MSAARWWDGRTREVVAARKRQSAGGYWQTWERLFCGCEQLAPQTWARRQPTRTCMSDDCPRDARGRR